MRLISQLRREDRESIGSKAATLGELHDQGLRIPPGFVITDDVFRSHDQSQPDQFAGLIAHMCAQLDPSGGSTFAVRSCAQFEDGPTHSLAGRFETFLNVAVADVPQSAQLIWRSCDAASGGRASVIVQKMVDASHAGVIFTVNPVTGNPTETVIEVVDGLGDQLVGGLVTPTRYIVEIVDGSTREKLGPARAQLPSSQIAKLVNIGRIANRVFGVACELEWAITDDQVFVLQCRPITALPTASPDSTQIKARGERSRYRQQYESRNARPWYTETSVGVFGRSLGELVGFEYRDIISVTDSGMRTRGFHDAQELARATDHFAVYWRDPDRVAEFLALCDRGFARAKETLVTRLFADWSTVETPILVAETQRAHELFGALFRTMVVTQPQHVEPLETALRELVAGEADPEGAMVSATRCARSLPNDSEERELTKLRERLCAGVDPADLNQELDRLADRYGWIAAVESGEPYSREHYRNRLLHAPPSRAEFPSVALPTETARIGSLIGELGNYRLWNRYYFMAIRHYLQRIIDVLVARSGESFLTYATVTDLLTWYSTGQVDEATIAARGSGYTATLVDGRTSILTGERAASLARLAEGSAEPDSGSGSSPVEVTGDCASPGRVTGRVRVVSFVSDDYDDAVADFRSGEILVTGMTRPQIAHLCDRAAAIVTDEGGITCHAAVIGREWGIPTLVATHDATKVLRTGDLVYLDAQEGYLTVVTDDQQSRDRPESRSP